MTNNEDIRSETYPENVSYDIIENISSWTVQSLNHVYLLFMCENIALMCRTRKVGH